MNSPELIQDCLFPAGVNPSPVLPVWNVIQPPVKAGCIPASACSPPLPSPCHSLFERRIILASSQHTKPSPPLIRIITSCKWTQTLPSTGEQTGNGQARVLVLPRFVLIFQPWARSWIYRFNKTAIHLPPLYLPATYLWYHILYNQTLCQCGWSYGHIITHHQRCNGLMKDYHTGRCCTAMPRG